MSAPSAALTARPQRRDDEALRAAVAIGTATTGHRRTRLMRGLLACGLTFGALALLSALPSKG